MPLGDHHIRHLFGDPDRAGPRPGDQVGSFLEQGLLLVDLLHKRQQLAVVEGPAGLGFKEAEMASVAGWIADIVDAMSSGGDVDAVIARVSGEVSALTARFPVYRSSKKAG